MGGNAPREETPHERRPMRDAPAGRLYGGGLENGDSG